MKHIPFYLILILALSSCITEVKDIKLDADPKIVLFCQLSPQKEYIEVKLSNSIPLFNRQNRQMGYISNGIVEISRDQVNWVRIPCNSDGLRYMISTTEFPILEGQDYYIKASAPGYADVSASCRVPYQREVNFTLDSFSETVFSEFLDDSYKFTFKWNDFPGEQNYYILYNYAIELYYDYVTEDSTYNLYMDYSLISDAYRDGNEIKTSMYYSNPEDSVSVLFVQADKSTYLFEESLRRYRQYEGMETFVEPTLIYSNVKNGFGIFGAYVFRQYKYRIDWESKKLSGKIR